MNLTKNSKNSTPNTYLTKLMNIICGQKYSSLPLDIVTGPGVLSSRLRGTVDNDRRQILPYSFKIKQ